MRFKTTIAALMLAAFPTLTIAEGCGWQHIEQSASPCPEGMVLDGTNGTCVKQTTS